MSFLYNKRLNETKQSPDRESPQIIFLPCIFLVELSFSQAFKCRDSKKLLSQFPFLGLENLEQMVSMNNGITLIKSRDHLILIKS